MLNIKSLKVTTQRIIKLTCDQERAPSCPGLVGDVTGVLAVALPVQSSDVVVRVVSLVTELSDSQEAGAQLPLIS